MVEDKTPTKKTLGRGDVSKAMNAVKPKALSCYKAEKFSGVVNVKFSVSPEGKITKAAAKGAHAGSKTGACVVKAVNSAKFPAFAGTVMSFTFPFLLSP